MYDWNCTYSCIYAFGILKPISNFMAPLTVLVAWSSCIYRCAPYIWNNQKRIHTSHFVALFGADLAGVLTPVQFIVLALIECCTFPACQQ